MTIGEKKIKKEYTFYAMLLKMPTEVKKLLDEDLAGNIEAVMKREDVQVTTFPA